MSLTATARPRCSLLLRGTLRTLGDRTWVMGVLNVTPDSFSDGGLYLDEATAVRRGLELVEAGADVVDVGGESTRPGGARLVDPEVERRRVLPVIEALRKASDVLLSVDTSKAAVARAALDAGADIVNDVSGATFDPAMAPLLAERRAPLVLMHLRGDFSGMHRTPAYRDVMGEVKEELGAALQGVTAAGVSAEQVVLDPGLGFAKAAPHTLEALRRLPELHALGRPVLVGPSRKSFIGQVLDLPVGERMFGTAAAVAAAVLAGAHVVRVHDVKEMVQVVRVTDAIRGDA